jgi:hypothetical protein
MPHTPSDAALSIDQLLTDTGYLVHTDPAEVLPLLARATSAPARLAAAVYRTSFERHRRVDAVRRRQALSLDAARWGTDELARQFAAVPVTPEAAEHGANVLWDTGTTPNDRLIRRFEGRTERVESLATAVLDGRPVAGDRSPSAAITSMTRSGCGMWHPVRRYASLSPTTRRRWPPRRYTAVRS